MKAPVRQYGRETGQPPSQSQGPLSHHETYTLQSQVPRANFPRLLLGCLTQPVSWCLSQNSKQCQPLSSVAALQPQTGRGNILSLHLGSGRLGERETALITEIHGTFPPSMSRLAVVSRSSSLSSACRYLRCVQKMFGVFKLLNPVSLALTVESTFVYI